MNKLRNIIKNLFLGLMMVWSANGFAQVDKLTRALDLYQSRNMEAARLCIDSVVKHPDTRKDFASHTIRAFVYHDFYRRSDRHKFNSALRDTIIFSLKRSYALKPDEENLGSNNRLMHSISGDYFNLSKKLLDDSANYNRSVGAYEKSKELSRIVKPDSNFTTRDIEFHVAAGSAFLEIYNNDYNNAQAAEYSKLSLLKALDWQPDNPSANYNLGLMYYNQAVNIGKSLDYGIEISQIDAVQESMVKLAKKAEQLITFVYQKNNNNAKAAEALYFIYRMLNQKEKSNQFKERCKDLGVKVEE
jgi:hypothetical protein